MVLIWSFLKLTNYIAVKKKYPFLISGKYLITKYYCNLSYSLQLILWLMIITLVKLILFYGVLMSFSSSLATIGTTILSPISNNDGDKGDLILRIPLSSECGGTLVFSYYRN